MVPHVAGREATIAIVTARAAGTSTLEIRQFTTLDPVDSVGEIDLLLKIDQLDFTQTRLILALPRELLSFTMEAQTFTVLCLSIMEYDRINLYIVESRNF